MTTWEALAPAKVNLTLFVGRPRAQDGYHPLASLVQALELCDRLTLTVGAARVDTVHCPGVPGDNLAARAITAFREATGWDGPPVTVTIEKRIPVAAGMGGGSSDAAATLRLLASASGVPVPDGLAATLGADVTSLLAPGRVLMSGIGERVEPVAGVDPRGYVVIPDPEGLSTPAVYGEFDRQGLGRPTLEGLSHDVPANDLEPAAVALHPRIARTLDRARALPGARVAMVSGSGPTVFAIFDSPSAAAAAAATLPGSIATRAVASADFGAPRRTS